MRIGKIRFLRLAAGETGEADGVVQAKSLQQFRIVIDLAALPEPRVEKQAVAPGRLRLPRRGEAVWAGIERAEGGIALSQIGGLAVDFPAVGFRIGQRRLRRQAAEIGPVNLPVEAEAYRLHLHARGKFRPRIEQDVGLVEPAVEIFDPPRPMRREGIFQAGAGRPTEPDMDVLLFIAHRRCVDEAPAGISEAAGGVGKPWAGGVANAAAHGADIVPLLVEIGARGRKQVHNGIRRDVVRKGEIALDAKQET